MDIAKVKNIIAEHSPYLNSLAGFHEDILHDIALSGSNECWENLRNSLQREFDELFSSCTDIVSSGASTIGSWRQRQEEIKRLLRVAKQRIALLTAVSDISGAWSLSDVTYTLSWFADYSVQQVLRFLLMQAVSLGQVEFVSGGESCCPENSGIFILGMGKLGGFDLNYSSDIDIIVMYEPDMLEYRGRHTLQHFMNRLVQDLVNMMQDRNEYGYVFRTDLRLRPDPSSTPLAIKIGAAIAYYESVGQNWERAAMIKSRVIAGDRNAAERFMKEIQYFIWRKHLDFAAINDILSIKRQMNHANSGDISLYSHNVKTGIGGIREIEFFAQIHQLIWGGRYADLRLRNTIAVLDKLVDIGLSEAHIIDELKSAYRFLRMVEHRLQMVNDQQTHSLPSSDEGMEKLASFMFYDSRGEFERDVRKHLENVHGHYIEAFKDSEPLSGSKGGDSSLVFTGVDYDERTLETLRNMGFEDAERVAATIMGWHKGNRRSTRTARSREILTEITPILLEEISNTASPDEAFKRFDDFINALPAGVQIFSLFMSNKQLINLIARIMGSAPSLGEDLSHNPYLLDSVLTGDFYAELADKEVLSHELEERLIYARDEDDETSILIQFQKEKQFQAGVQLLDGMVSVGEASYFLTILAELVVEHSVRIVSRQFERSYGKIIDSELVIIALGKAGSYDLSFGSDLDIVFTYDMKASAKEELSSDGKRSLSPSVYYNRLAQRIVGFLTAKHRYGVLYEVDTRLRPFGKDSALAHNLEFFNKYYNENAWSIERLALVRARVIYTETVCAREKISDIILRQLCKRIAVDERKKIAEEIRQVRCRISEQHRTDNVWDIKYIRGGMLDCDMLIQYWTVIYAYDHPDMLSSYDIYSRLSYMADRALVDADIISKVKEARKFLSSVLAYLRLCSGSGNVTGADTMPEGLKSILYKVTKTHNFVELRNELVRHQKNIANYFYNL